MQGAQCIIPIALEVHLSPAGTEVKFIPSCFDLCLLKWLRTSLPEGTWNSLCCGLQLWLQVLELWATARLIWSEICIFCISTYFAGVLIFFFFFQEPVLCKHGEEYYHDPCRLDDYIHLVRLPAWQCSFSFPTESLHDVHTCASVW